MYVLDSGGRALVTKHKVSDDGSELPSRIVYGSGKVVGYRTKALIELGEIELNTTILHRVNEFPFRKDADGIFGLLPSRMTKKAGLRSVEIDFLNRQVRFNVPSIYQNSTCVNNFQHPRFFNKLWFFGDMRAYDTNGAEYTKKDIYFMLDTGATKAMTFFSSNFGELDTCVDAPGLVRIKVDLKDGNVIDMSVPSSSRWPVCLPTKKQNINFVILGLQALSSLKSVYFEYADDGDRISRLCVSQH